MTKNLKIFTDNIEDEAVEQINELLNQPAFKDSKIRIMPDVHAGKGCVIGFTGDLGDKVIPNIVGVDIGCGMLCIELGNIDINFQKLDEIIKKYIPSGYSIHETKEISFKKIKNLNCYRELKDTKRFERSIKTLGGGNHFIEIDIDDENNKYLIIHTGSRNLGKQVAEYYQEVANQMCNFNKSEFLEKKEKLIKEYKELGKTEIIQEALKELKTKYLNNLNLIPKHLSYLEGKLKDEYLEDMKICQEFASLNREQIAKEILNNLKIFENVKSFETIHNYISFSDNIVRKGAISAKKGEKVLIPLNMRDGCIIAIGKGNEDWNSSAPHGAGRIMSRKKAKETFKIEDYKETMKNIYTTSVNESTIDEAPSAYKPMDEIIKCINDTVEIIKIIKPIYNYKASV